MPIEDFEALTETLDVLADPAAMKAISDSILGTYPRPEGYDFPTVDDGVEGMAFIEAAVASSKENATWKPVHGV